MKLLDQRIEESPAGKLIKTTWWDSVCRLIMETVEFETDLYHKNWTIEELDLFLRANDLDIQLGPEKSVIRLSWMVKDI